MAETIKDLFTAEEWQVFSEFAGEISAAAQNMPTALLVDMERMEEDADE